MKNIIPTIWKNAIIVPIPKSVSKDPYVPLNYKGISLLYCVYKLFTSLLNLRISDHCEAYDYLVDEQNGFRPKRSCQDHIYSISTIIRNRKTIGLNTCCAFVDVQKAFDRVNRELLMYKLATVFRIHGRLFNMISTIYDSSNAQLRSNGLLTESFFVSSGVRQGDVMSHTLFSMYINDLATGLKRPQLWCNYWWYEGIDTFICWWYRLDSTRRRMPAKYVRFCCWMVPEVEDVC